MMSMGQDFALQYSAVKPEYNRSSRKKEEFCDLAQYINSSPSDHGQYERREGLGNNDKIKMARELKQIRINEV